MVLTGAQFRLVLLALVGGGALGVVAAWLVARPLRRDLRRLRDVTRGVADGHLDVTTGIARRDEVGDLAEAVDRMVEQLAGLERSRERDDEARRQLFIAIGHDLRTPLASLQAAAEALQDGVSPDPHRYLRSMTGDVRLLRGMVDDLFVLAQLEAGALHLERLPLDLAELVDGAVEASAPIARRRGLHVQADLDGGVPVVGDARALDRVLRNLLDNAIRHAPEGTRVEVRVRGDARGCTVTVRDQGPGFPADFEPRAFDRFARADASRTRAAGGAGLGLAIARELLEAHGGSIWLGDVEGTAGPAAGGVVSFRLPRADGRDGGAR
ncbi:sensor histidine kinase [Egicoccus sp. AB-alg2]|uniref:sensor histidine kinase n=1 Tax=Egicoccus sp. AB-alg2 TaxID=3242693 RepID=UPI00359E9706